MKWFYHMKYVTQTTYTVFLYVHMPNLVKVFPVHQIV